MHGLYLSSVSWLTNWAGQAIAYLIVAIARRRLVLMVDNSSFRSGHFIPTRGPDWHDSALALGLLNEDRNGINVVSFAGPEPHLHT
jgi:hypothetical protein